MDGYYPDETGFGPNDYYYSDELEPIGGEIPYANLQGAYAHAEEHDTGYETVNDDDVSNFEPGHGEDAEGEEYDEGILEPMEGIIAESAAHHTKASKMPLPPMELLDSDPIGFLFQFMFLPRPVRTPDHLLEFWALFWEPIDDMMRMHGCEYLSLRLVKVMNENAELERRVKKSGTRRTKVLTDDVYSPITIKLMTSEQWDYEDVVWCICEGMKKYPKEVNKNKRFRERLSLSIPDRDDLGDAARAARRAATLIEADKKKAAIEAAAGKKATAKNPPASRKATKEAATKKPAAGKLPPKTGGRAHAAASAKASSSAAKSSASGTKGSQKANTKAAAAPKAMTTPVKGSNKRVIEFNSDENVSSDNVSPKKKPCTPNTKAGRKVPASTPRGRRSAVGKDEAAGNRRGVKQETPTGKNRIPADWCDECYPVSSESSGKSSSDDEYYQLANETYFSGDEKMD